MLEPKPKDDEPVDGAAVKPTDTPADKPEGKPDEKPDWTEKK